MLIHPMLDFGKEALYNNSLNPFAMFNHGGPVYPRRKPYQEKINRKKFNRKKARISRKMRIINKRYA